MLSSPRIFITGASCAGVTTLGQALASRLGVPHLEVDAFYWLPTDPPYSTKRAPEERVALIRQRQQASDGWVLAGSCDGWGEALTTAAELIVLVDTPTPLRLQRLQARELSRHGARILPGGDMYEAHRAFVAWASSYDDPDFSGRNRARHLAWLAAQRAMTLQLDGSDAVPTLVAACLHALEVARERKRD